jgi:erythromycin esterase
MLNEQSSGQNPSAEQAVINAWLRQNAIPLPHIEAGDGFADLQPLKSILKDVKVVGLGEATHGTREFFQIKHRLLEFLVVEMGFNAFALEASYAACQPINDYVLHGRGDRATVLTGQGYIPWDTEEFSEMLDWLRAYNQGVPAESKVKFYGVDLWRNEIGRAAVLAYLRQVAPGEVAAAESLFRVLATEEAKWPRRIDEESRRTLRQVLPQLQVLIDHLTAHEDEFARRSSPADLGHALRYARVMQQWIVANTAEVQVQSRSPFMAENLVYLLDQEKPGTRYVVWAHNGHVGMGQDWRFGCRLREQYGQGYYAFGFEFNQGSFQSRTELSDTVLGDLKAISLPPAPERSLPWHLSHTNIGNLVFDLRAPAGDPAVERWLHSPQIVHTANWVCPDGFEFNIEMNLAEEYDGIVFVERTTATRPTANALKTAADRAGL